MLNKNMLCDLIIVISVFMVAITGSVLIILLIVFAFDDGECRHADAESDVKAYFSCACSCDACRGCTGVTVD